MWPEVFTSLGPGTWDWGPGSGPLVASIPPLANVDKRKIDPKLEAGAQQKIPWGSENKSK